MLTSHTYSPPRLGLGNSHEAMDSTLSLCTQMGSQESQSSGGHCQSIRHGQCLCVCVHAHTPAYVRTPAHMCICTHMHTHVYTCTHSKTLHMCTHSHNAHIYTNTHVHTRVHICACTHTHTETRPAVVRPRALSLFVFGSDHSCHEAEKTDAGPRALAPAQGNWDTHVCKESGCEV